ncbi:FAD-binding oxidoreductase [Paenibacillus sp. SC116]|uniref:NAD(P)/FAD-dependent oxidoreductase n=1 Tax=Paenibacillus sp. SC116 TaxID=2968986 RepID=UPI00215B6F22|nr:FAD-dependent oxidoreductase [Paenibacillus sp. SC116]MCR8842154.1 FAD-binding oxidoreductase [Paenibacillus sp. SC116]
MKTMDVVVIGGGIIGAFVACKLNKSGFKRIALLEKLEIGNGATGQSGGIVRVYHSDPLLSNLALEGFKEYQAECDLSEQECAFTRTGFLYMESTDELSHLQRECSRLSANGAAVEVLSIQEGTRRFPEFKWSDLKAAVYEPDAGYMDPLLATKALTRKLADRGVELYEGIEVYEILQEHGQTIGVRTSAETIYCPHVIICAGAWSSTLLTDHIISEKIRSKSIQFQVVKLQHAPRTGFIDSAMDLYSRPYRNGLTLVGLPVDEWDIDIENRKSIDLDQERRVLLAAQQRLSHWGEVSTYGGRKSFDAYSLGGCGIVEEVPGLRGTIIASGFSGSGVKIAPAVGNRVVQLLT